MTRCLLLLGLLSLVLAVGCGGAKTSVPTATIAKPSAPPAKPGVAD
jgi:hypothetical protein